MQGHEFYDYFHKTPILKKNFKGVFAINTIPKNLKYRHFCICNTDKNNGSGIHWFCFVRTSKETIECFDSLGVNDEKKQTLKSSCKFKGIKEMIFNETQFQSDVSDTCGLFSIYFIVERMFNLDLSFEEILSDIFDPENHLENENKVKEFYETF